MFLRSPRQGLSSIEPDDAGGQMDGPQEIACGLVVSCGNGPILLESGKEVLNLPPAHHGDGL